MNERDKVEQAELDRYRIQRIPTDMFVSNGLAAAKRNAK